MYLVSVAVLCQHRKLGPVRTGKKSGNLRVPIHFLHSARGKMTDMLDRMVAELPTPQMSDASAINDEKDLHKLLSMDKGSMKHFDVPALDEDEIAALAFPQPRRRRFSVTNSDGSIEQVVPQGVAKASDLKDNWKALQNDFEEMEISRCSSFDRRCLQGSGHGVSPMHGTFGGSGFTPGFALAQVIQGLGQPDDCGEPLFEIGEDMPPVGLTAFHEDLPPQVKPPQACDPCLCISLERRLTVGVRIAGARARLQ